jgi:excisionase family DNA binding protein
MSSSEAADYMGIAKYTLKNWGSEGKIEVAKVGRLNKFKRVSPDKFIEPHMGISYQIREHQKSKRK